MLEELGQVEVEWRDSGESREDISRVSRRRLFMGGKSIKEKLETTP